MQDLNFVNLIQAAMVSVGVLGSCLLWRSKGKEFRGIALFLLLMSLSACINILEESGLTRDIYLISPAFVLLFGPTTYLAIKLLLNKQLAKIEFLHLLPAAVVLLFTSYAYAVIAIGSIWRLVYACLTILILVRYKRLLDEERSDSDDYSLSWMAWLLAITATFNVIDLIRLNMQHILSPELNILGQGLNNLLWLVVAMVIVIKLQLQPKIPERTERTYNTNNTCDDNNYLSLFAELDTLVKQQQCFLTPRLTLQQISSLTGLQTRDISRAINTCAKKSFNEYINSYRVEYVCQKLQQARANSVTDIATEAGFSSKATFNKVFKQVTGLTPTEYKQQKV